MITAHLEREPGLLGGHRVPHQVGRPGLLGHQGVSDLHAHSISPDDDWSDIVDDAAVDVPRLGHIMAITR
jgi:hypothetical protein